MKSTRQSQAWYRSINLARLLLALVLVSNLYAALGFLFSPQQFTAAYELAGIPGEVAVAAIGLLFLMWQVPYLVAFIYPVRHKISLLEALIMQSLGLIGETFILFRIPGQHAVLKSGITRFIVFDLAGLALLVIAWLIVNGIIREIERKNGI